jgi:hypothetical protein
MADRFPGYDVLAKRDSPSWNEQTRRVVQARLAVPDTPNFFTPAEYAAVVAIAARLVPQAMDGRPAIPVAALVDHKLVSGRADGYRGPGMPPERGAWRRGLHALEEEARQSCGAGFAALTAEQQDELLRRMEQGALTHPAWGGMPSQTFFQQRLGRDIVLAYYAHPTAWSRIGFGGPASPRGYVRMDYDERDPWEAAEARPGHEQQARRDNQRVG